MSAQGSSIAGGSGRGDHRWGLHKMVILVVMLSLLVATWAGGVAGAASPPPQESEKVHTVQAADSLSDLADKYYGNPGLWPAIWLATNAKAAEDDSFETILNPNALKVGQNLWIPDAEEAAALMAGYLVEKEAVLAAAPKTMRLPDLGGQTVVAVTENAYTPLNFVDPLTGEAVGWEYDAVNEICRRLDCELDWQITSWDTMIAAVRNGQFDVGMDGITITDERKEQVDFSDAYMVSQQFMLVRAGEDRFATPEEFGADPDLLIGSQTGTTNFYVAVYEVLDGDESNPRIKLFENFGAAVQALITGDVDMVLMDAASSRGYVGANPDKLAVIGEPLGTEEFGFIFTPGSDLAASFNAAIAQMKADGYLDYLNNKWFFITDPNAEDVYDQLPDLGGQTVVAVTENAYTPLNFVDPVTGEAVGWEYEAVDEICRRLDCELDWQITSWDAMIAAVRSGQFDVGMDGITITDERKEQVDFSDAYMVSQQFMLVGAGEDRFATPEEFGADPDLLIGSQTGTTNFYVAVYDVLDGDESNPRIMLFENFGAAVQALIAGDVDMVLMDAASSRGYIGANPDKLALIGEPLGTEEFGFIFTPGSDLVDSFNKALKTMQEDGFLEQLNTRWFFMYDPSSGPAEDTTEESTTEAAQDVTLTEVIEYVPTVPTGDAQDGSCWTSSIAVPREGAWRCTVDSSISDPCFALPDDPNAVVCDPNPATGDPGFKMNLTEPLPAPDLGDGSADFLKNNGWMIELADGMVCSFFTGATAPVNGKRISYGCTKEYSIIGDLHPGTVWQAERVDTDNLVTGDDGMTAEETEMVNIRTLWQ